jgi:hypothetical protein
VASVFKFLLALQLLLAYEYKVDLTRHPKFPLVFGELTVSLLATGILNILCAKQVSVP